MEDTGAATGRDARARSSKPASVARDAVKELPPLEQKHTNRSLHERTSDSHTAPNGSGRAPTTSTAPASPGGHCSCKHSAETRWSRECEREYRQPEMSVVSDVSVLIVDPLPPLHMPHSQQHHQQRQTASRSISREFDEHSSARVPAGPMLVTQHNISASDSVQPILCEGQLSREEVRPEKLPQQSPQQIRVGNERQQSHQLLWQQVQLPHAEENRTSRSDVIRFAFSCFQLRARN